MTKENRLVVERRAAENVRLTRRKMVQRLLAGAGAGSAWPVIASSHPICELFRNNVAVFNETEKLAQRNWKPVFLSLQQHESLVAVAESIVPGSSKAHVSRFIDLLLSVDKPENRHTFVESLAAIDAETQKRFGKRFTAIDEEQKNSFLTDASLKSNEPDASATGAEPKQSTLYAHFESLKGWISGAYYSSEAGMREMGWSGDYGFEKFPGCTHPDGHYS